MERDYYETPSLNEAAALYCLDNPRFPIPPEDWLPAGSDPKREGRSVFRFSDYLLRLEQGRRYHQGELTGNIRDFVEAQNLLRDSVKGTRR